MMKTDIMGSSEVGVWAFGMEQEMTSVRIVIKGLKSEIK